jgi:methyl-branched lipid omega-hydroxylase
MLGEPMRRVPTIRAAGEPDRLLSSFINGIKQFPCEFD